MLPLSKNKLKEAPAEEINPINEAQSKLEVSFESCNICDPDSEAVHKNTPSKHPHEGNFLYDIPCLNFFSPI